jgi:uroporphyrinogen decarboxylase
MNAHERVLMTLHHQQPDRVPKYARFTPGAIGKFRPHLGDTDYRDYFDLDIRHVGLRPSKRMVDFRAYYEVLPPNVAFDDWGLPFVTGSEFHQRYPFYPLQHLQEPRQLDGYAWPDFSELYRHQHLEAEIERWHDLGYAVLGREREISGGFVFETAWQLRGMEALFIDFYQNPAFAAALLDRITDINAGVCARFVEAGVDILWLGDDVGMQNRMLMHPETWRHWLKPRLKSLIDSARAVRPDIFIFYHSDGYIDPIIPDLIEIGVDILNPVQPESMDAGQLKSQYGDQLSFWGTISVQTVLPRGTTKQVRAAVQHMTEVMGRGGGFVIGPCHYVQDDVPWKNVKALFEAILEFGSYA